MINYISYSFNSKTFIQGANWVLTTADCCDGVALDMLFTAANDWDAAAFYDSETVHVPDRKIIHPGFRKATKQDNICLLHYSNDMMLINGILKADIACLPFPGRQFVKFG